MCTLFLALAPCPGIDLAVSANRNEFLKRPAASFALWDEEPGAPRIAAPRDLQAGGTWQGVNGAGLFVCVTNRHGAQLDAQRISRGTLVAEALRCGSVEDARERFRELDGAAYNGFHLGVCDRREGLLLIGDGVKCEMRALGPGLHLITERSFGAGEGFREREALRAFGEIVSRGQISLEELRQPMTAHAPESEPLEAACVHADGFGYGTRSSLQLLVPSSGAASALYTDGHPCTTPARDLSALIAPLLAS